MKILLVVSCTGKKVRESLFPISVLYLAGKLISNGHEVVILDMENLWFRNIVCSENQILAELSIAIRKFNPDIVGFSALYSGAFPFILPMARKAKEIVPDCLIVVGGIHATIFYEKILLNVPEIDIVVCGEGEEVLAAIADSAKIGDWQDISSIAWRHKNGNILYNQRTRYITQLDSLPKPAYKLIDFDNYRYDFSYYYNPNDIPFDIVTPVLASRSCPMQCCFCAMHLVMGKKLRYRSPKKVVDEIEYLYDEHGIRYFSFVDDNITLNHKHAYGIFEQIIERKLDIVLDCLGGLNVNSLDRRLLETMKEAGVVYTPLAIEHGDDFIRNSIIKKGLMTEKIYEIANVCKDIGIRTKGLFVLGFLEETYDSIMRTKEMIEKLDLDMVRIFNLQPFPGTEVFRQAKKEKLFTKEMDLENMWRKEIILDDGETFYLKPRNMTLSGLKSGRELLDNTCKKLSTGERK